MSLGLSLSLAFLLLSPSVVYAEAPCAAPVTEAQLGAVLSRAETHFSALEAELMAADLVEANAGVRCLSGVISPAVAAQLHRATGLLAELQGDTAARQRAFAAAIAADPTWRFPKSLLPPGNPAAKGYLASSSLDRGLLDAPAPAPDVLLFWDGAPGAQRPTAVPTVFQVRWGPTELVYSGLLMPSDPLPGYPVPTPPDAIAALEDPEVPPVEMPTDQEARRAKITRVSLLAGGGGLLLVSGGAALGAVSNRAAFEEEFLGEDARAVYDVDENAEEASDFLSDVEAREDRARLLVGSAIGAGALGAAALTVGVTLTW